MNGLFRSLLGASLLGTSLVCCRGGDGDAAGDWRSERGAPATAQGATAQARAVAAAPATVTLDIPGMFCGGCALATRTALTRIEGVRSADVTLDTRRAVVSYDPERVTVERLVAAVAEAGFTAAPVDERRPGGGG